jgi:hypothetical protein
MQKDCGARKCAILRASLSDGCRQQHACVQLLKQELHTLRPTQSLIRMPFDACSCSRGCIAGAHGNVMAAGYAGLELLVGMPPTPAPDSQSELKLHLRRTG